VWNPLSAVPAGLVLSPADASSFSPSWHLSASGGLNIVMLAWICPTPFVPLRLPYKRMHLDGSLARQVPACCSENSGLRPHESPISLECRYHAMPCISRMPSSIYT
ncbi:hypothetical protein GQ607_016146, partial [Colletotrichum asianum]